MKKMLVGMLILLLCVGLWGCGNQKEPVEEATAVPTQSQLVVESTEPAEEVETYYDDNGNTVEISYDENGNAVQTYCDEDGNTVQTYNDENGNAIVVCIAPDGSRTETCNNTDGSMVSIYDDPATGAYIETEFSKAFVRIREKGYDPATGRHTETEYYENGNLKWANVWNPSSGFTSEQEYYENGNRKWMKTREPDKDEEMDAQYNEEGYCTYYRSSYIFKKEPYEIECFGDETGKLIKVIENGVETDDAKLFALCISNYNFRK